VAAFNEGMMISTIGIRIAELTNAKIG